MFLLFGFCCGTPSLCLKVRGWWWVGGWVGGGLEQFSVSPRPLGFGFGAKGLGPGLDNYIDSLLTQLLPLTAHCFLSTNNHNLALSSLEKVL